MILMLLMAIIRGISRFFIGFMRLCRVTYLSVQRGCFLSYSRILIYLPEGTKNSFGAGDHESVVLPRQILGKKVVIIRVIT